MSPGKNTLSPAPGEDRTEEKTQQVCRAVVRTPDRLEVPERTFGSNVRGCGDSRESREWQVRILTKILTNYVNISMLLAD